MSSDEDDATLMASFKQKRSRKPAQVPSRQRASRSSEVAMSEQSATVDRDGSQWGEAQMPRRAIGVRVSPVRDREEFKYYEPQKDIENIVREFKRRGDMFYKVRLFGNTTKEVRAHGKGRENYPRGKSKGRPAEAQRAKNGLPLYSSVSLPAFPIQPRSTVSDSTSRSTSKNCSICPAVPKRSNDSNPTKTIN